MFGISQPISLLLASYLTFKKGFHTILRWVKVLSLRYNIICREHTGEQENLYSDTCVLISNGCDIGDIKKKLLVLYPDDEKFKLNFSDKTFTTKQSNKKARYLLARLEESESNTPINEAMLTVEYILPENPDHRWEEYFGSNWQKFNQRLGNMALIDADSNMSQESFDEKKQVLSNSIYKANKNVGKYSEWNEGTINSRQIILAEIACNLWRID